MSTNIKQIKVGEEFHYIDATYINGKLASNVISDLESQIHGAIETYVIPTSKSGVTGYDKVVAATAAQTSTTKSILKALTSSSTDFKVGDVILMGATSDGTKNFDRWVSEISGDTINLDVLETHVATHHHTITTDSAKALTGVKTLPSINVANVDTAVSVVTSGIGIVVTSVAYNGNASHTIALTTAKVSDSGAVGHTHTLNSHTHSVTLGHNDLVETTVDVYNTLASVSYQLHTHNGNVDVAGKTSTSANAINVVTGIATSANFIKSLKDETATTEVNTSGLVTGANTAGKVTGANTAGKVTGVQVSSSAASSVVTGSAGGHEHTVSVETDSSVITSVNIAPKVVTNVTVNNDASVATSVITSAKLTGDTSFVKSWTCSVNTSGILSFTPSTGSVGLTVTSCSQYINAPTVTVDSVAQTYTSAKITATGSATTAGGHTHGFTHTHTIAEHTHSIAGHTHSIEEHTHGYEKRVEETSGNAIVTLGSVSYKLHTHADNESVAGAKNAGSTVNVVTGGTQVSVVAALKDSETFTTTSSRPGMDTKYYKISGSIEMPGLSVTRVSTYTLLHRDPITPAKSAGKALTNITFNEADFINSVDGYTSENYGGKFTNGGGDE